jgi:phosphoribosylcarboxyaminoimidazole (NCAIR) mutase
MHRDAIVVEFHKLRNATVECRMAAIDAGIQVAHADAGAREAALPASLDAKTLQPPGQLGSGPGVVHFEIR